MKGKNAFMPQEIQELKRLIAKKVRAKPNKQKTIRNQIRKIGFYYSDFSSDKHGYTTADLDSLIASGQIRVIPSFAAQYPYITNWVMSNGSIEIGQLNHYRYSMARVILEDNLIWEGKTDYATIDELLQDLENGLLEWEKENL